MLDNTSIHGWQPIYLRCLGLRPAAGIHWKVLPVIDPWPEDEQLSKTDTEKNDRYMYIIPYKLPTSQLQTVNFFRFGKLTTAPHNSSTSTGTRLSVSDVITSNFVNSFKLRIRILPSVIARSLRASSTGKLLLILRLQSSRPLRQIMNCWRPNQVIAQHEDTVTLFSKGNWTATRSKSSSERSKPPLMKTSVSWLNGDRVSTSVRVHVIGMLSTVSPERLGIR